MRLWYGLQDSVHPPLVASPTIMSGSKRRNPVIQMRIIHMITYLCRISGLSELMMTRQRWTAIKVNVKIPTLNVTVTRGQMNLQKNSGKSIPPKSKTLTGKESSSSVKSDVDKLKISISFTDLRCFFQRMTRTSEFPVTPSRNVSAYKASFICFSVSLTDEKFVGCPAIDTSVKKERLRWDMVL